MGCPSPLQAHQIQGGDHVAIFPVIRWLVTKVLEYRRITGDYVRLSSEEAFDRSYTPFAPSAGARGASSNPSTLSSVLRAVSSLGPGATSASVASSLALAASTEASAAACQTAGGGEAKGTGYITETLARYAPVRRYRRGVTADCWKRGLIIGKEWGSRVDALALPPSSALLEFGERTLRSTATAGTTEVEAGESTSGVGVRRGGAAGGDKKTAAASRAVKQEEMERRRAAVEAEEKMMREMGGGSTAAGGAASTSTSSSSGGGGVVLTSSGPTAGTIIAATNAAIAAGVSGANVGALLNLQSEELRKAAAEYKQTEEELKALALSGDLLANSKAGRAAAHARRVGALTKRVEGAESERGAGEEALLAVQSEAESVRSKLVKCERRLEKARGEVQKLDDIIAALPPNQAAALRALFQAHVRSEGLAAQVEGFKASARRQRASMTALLASAQAENAEGATAIKLRELEGGRAERLARYNRARAAIAEKARQEARLARFLDEIPGRGELQQFERRFAELDSQQTLKLDENRKYFQEYETLREKCELMCKQSSQIQNILEMSGDALKGGGKSASAYLTAIETQFIKALETRLSRAKAVEASKKAVVGEKASQLAELVTAQRKYYRTVQELQVEVERNEALRLEREGQAGARATTT